MVMQVVQSCEYAENHFKIVKAMIFILCEFYLNKPTFKKKRVNYLYKWEDNQAGFRFLHGSIFS